MADEGGPICMSSGTAPWLGQLLGLDPPSASWPHEILFCLRSLGQERLGMLELHSSSAALGSILQEV